MITAGAWTRSDENPMLVCRVDCTACNLKGEARVSHYEMEILGSDQDRESLKRDRIEWIIQRYREGGCTHEEESNE